MRLYLIRHGETEYNHTQRVQGWGEVPLNDRGIAQAAQLARRVAADYSLDHIYTSDLRRTVMTACILGAETGAGLTHEPLYRERNPGDLSDKPYEEAMAFFLDDTYEPPNGESVSVFGERVGRACDHLVAAEGGTDRHIAVVSHGMFCNGFVRHCLDIDPREDPDFKWLNTCLTICDYTDGKWELQMLADASHLDESTHPENATGA
jgi:2,3-bisphosphoglycerate-dependent phosphoglycerate mutase